MVWNHIVVSYVKKYKVCPLLEDMVNNNQLGIKTGRGFYKY